MDAVDAIIAQWNRECPELDVGPMEIIGRLLRLSRHLAREQEKVYAAHGLTAAGFDVLATLRRSGPPFSLSPGRLMDTMMITSGTMTHRLDQLEKAGLVSRAEDARDRRVRNIALTDDGLALIDAAIVDHVANQRRLMATLSNRDRATLNRILRSLLAEH